jgi:hypothetical protein
MRLTITDASDPRLADYVSLRDASLRAIWSPTKVSSLPRGQRSSVAP